MRLKAFFVFFGALAGRCGFEPWRIEMAHWSVTICAAVSGWDKWIWLFDGAKELIILAVKGCVGRFNFHRWEKIWNRHQNNQWYAHLWSSRVSIRQEERKRPARPESLKNKKNKIRIRKMNVFHRLSRLCTRLVYSAIFRLDKFENCCKRAQPTSRCRLSLNQLRRIVPDCWPP